MRKVQVVRKTDIKVKPMEKYDGCWCGADEGEQCVESCACKCHEQDGDDDDE